MLNSKYKSLGVINRTPNSFSDLGASLNQSYFESQLQSFLADPTVIIDIGFESTAPMNSAISAQDELERFDEFLNSIKEFNFLDRAVSFDTYKVKNFAIMAQEFLKLHPEVTLIFNDVSGVLSEELKSVLKFYKDKKFYYIYTSSHIPSRGQVLNHMNFLDEKTDILDQTKENFLKAYEFFEAFGMERQLLLDAGFGFSKTYDQNWRLIQNYHKLEESLLRANITCPHVIGLSKKSFLKKALKEGETLEDLHQKCLNSLRKQAQLEHLYRVHDPKVITHTL